MQKAGSWMMMMVTVRGTDLKTMVYNCTSKKQLKVNCVRKLLFFLTTTLVHLWQLLRRFSLTLARIKFQKQMKN